MNLLTNIIYLIYLIYLLITDDLGWPTPVGRHLTGNQTRLTTFVSVFLKSSTAAARGEARPHIRVSSHLHRESSTYPLLHGLWPACSCHAETRQRAFLYTYSPGSVRGTARLEFRALRRRSLIRALTACYGELRLSRWTGRLEWISVVTGMRRVVWKWLFISVLQ